MAAIEELLEPIPGENPSGEDLRYKPIYDSIREARRQDDELAQGAWQRERKLADFPLVIKLATGALKTKSKDLQLMAWLTEAMLRKEGFSGLHQGLFLCKGLIENFWDTLYPEIEEGDLELRATPLEWMGSRLEEPVRSSPLTREGYGWYLHRESRTLGYDDQIKDANQKKAREKLIAGGKLAPEVFDKAFQETPKAFYSVLEKQLDDSLAAANELDALCRDKFGDIAPSFGKLKTSLEEVRQVAHVLLQKKRETEPDPVEEEDPVAADPTEDIAADGEPGVAVSSGAPVGGVVPTLLFLPVSSESPARQELVKAIANAAASLRRQEPLNPAPYLIMRGLRWGDLRYAAALSDPAMLEAPPTEIRLQIKRLALQEKWKELLDTAEAVMSLPCSRAWLDLQRFAVEACVALGRDYTAIAVAIRSELRALLQDVPQLTQCTLMDDTPAANLETRQWLRQLLAEPSAAAEPPAANGAEVSIEDEHPVRWQRHFLDPYLLAKEALQGDHADRALEIMRDEITRQRSPRGRFQRRIQFVELCTAAGKDLIAQPILEDLLATIDLHKLEEWEDKAVMASALVTLMHASNKIQGDAKEKQKYFERVCRLDPVQALNC
jgi:type VI secretion system protein ImpA